MSDESLILIVVGHLLGMTLAAAYVSFVRCDSDSRLIDRFIKFLFLVMAGCFVTSAVMRIFIAIAGG